MNRKLIFQGSAGEALGTEWSVNAPTVADAFRIVHANNPKNYRDYFEQDLEAEFTVKLAGESLDAGALGFSTGLFYAPGYYARTDEVIAIAEEAGKRNKLYSTHQRDEGSRTVGLFVSINEAIEIGRRADCRVQISHLKCAGPRVWGKAGEYMELLEQTVKEGVDVAGDQYPYPASSTALTGALFPRWALSGGREATLKYMTDEDARGRIIDEMSQTFNQGRRAD